MTDSIRNAFGLPLSGPAAPAPAAPPAPRHRPPPPGQQVLTQTYAPPVAPAGGPTGPQQLISPPVTQGVRRDLVDTGPFGHSHGAAAAGPEAILDDLLIHVLKAAPPTCT